MKTPSNLIFILVIIFSQTFSSSIHAQGYGRMWEEKYGYDSASSYIRGQTIAADHQGSTITVSVHDSLWSLYITSVIKYDLSGTVLWNKSFNNAFEIHQNPSVVVDSHDNIYIGGFSEDSTGYYDMRIVKLDAAGNQQGDFIYHSPPALNDFLMSMKIDQADNIFFCGQAELRTSPSYSDALVARIDTSGNLRWITYLNYPLIDTCYDSANILLLDRQDNPVIIGFIRGGEVAKLDSSGNILWTGTHYVPSALYFLKDAVTDDSSSVYISWCDSTGAPYLSKYDSGGNLKWRKQYFSPAVTINSLKYKNNNLYAAAESNLDRALVLKMNLNGDTAWTAMPSGSTLALQDKIFPDNDGSSKLISQYYDFGTGIAAILIAGYDSSGTNVSTQLYPDSASYTIFIDDAIADSAGNIIAVCDLDGESESYGVFYFDTAAIRWEDKRNNLQKGNDKITALGIDGQGNVIGGGSSDGMSMNGNDAIVLKYDPSGNILWRKRIAGHTGDWSVKNISFDAENNIYATVVQYYDTFFTKLDEAGNIIFTLDSVQNVAAVSTGGSTSVFNSRITFTNQSSLLIEKYDSAGALLWQRPVTDPDTLTGGLFISGAGNDLDFVMQNAQTGHHRFDICLVRTDTAASLIWKKHFVSSDTTSQQVKEIIHDAQNNLIVTSVSYRNFPHVSIMKFDSSGNHIWTNVIPSSAVLGSRNTTADEWGNVYYVLQYDSASISGLIAGKINAGGATAWQEHVRIAAGAQLIDGNTIAYGNNNIFITGRNLYPLIAGNPVVADFDTAGNLIYGDTVQAIDGFVTGYAVEFSNGCFYAGGNITNYQSQTVDAETFKYCAIPAGLAALKNRDSNYLFPDPATDKINLISETSFSHSVLEIYNAFGSLVSSLRLPDNSSAAEINVSDFRSGVYYARLSGEGDESAALRFMIVR